MSTDTRKTSLALLMVLGLALAANAAEPEFRSLFNSKDLTGWDGAAAYRNVVVIPMVPAK